MKDKKKQIEEIANCKLCCQELGSCGVKNREYCPVWKQAVRLYEQGYRKIDKDSVVLSREEFEEKLSMAHILDYVLTTHGYEMSYQGSLESTWNGFYMSSVSGLDIPGYYIPEVLYEQLELNGFYVDEEVYDSTTLCEFDCTWGSGWMYMVNGSFPNIPFCDYVPQDGDVMRVQFTLSYGADIGDWGIMGAPMFESVDKETLTKLIAIALEKGIDVTSAMEVVSTFGVTQEELDAACEELSFLING